MKRPEPFAKRLWNLSQVVGDADYSAMKLGMDICSDVLNDRDLAVTRDDLAELVEAVRTMRLFLQAAHCVASSSLGLRDDDYVWDADTRRELEDAVRWVDEKLKTSA